MKKTDNYSLPQWEKQDFIKMEDFNDAFGSIEQALTNMRTAAGTYTGNGAMMADGGQEIALGFKPKFVIITRGWLDPTFNPRHFYVAGEAAGGIHGRNRLMGNSLLDVIVFGRNAGQQAGAKCRSVRLGALSLEHVRRYEEALAQANIRRDVPSPKLLPDYTRKV